MAKNYMLTLELYDRMNRKMKRSYRKLDGGDYSLDYKVFLKLYYNEK